MRTALVSVAAGAAIIDRGDVHRQLNIDSAAADAKIDDLCAVATAMLDGADGWLKRALRSQQWRLVLPAFYDCDTPGRIVIPLPPLISVTAIKYLDADAVEQTVATSVYRVVNNGTERSFVMLKTGQAWPVHGSFPDAVRVEFTAGYGTAASDVPAPIRNAALLNLSHLFEFRGDDAEVPEMPVAAKNLVSNYRILNV